MSHPRPCKTHGLYPRCPACEAEVKPRDGYKSFAVPEGLMEYLRNAARYYASMGDEGAEEFVLWISVDLREGVGG